MYEVAVVGAGFAGSLFAAVAKRAGRSVVLLEAGQHPRFAIGESSTPLANLLWEELTARYDLPRLRALAKWGTWQAEHPDVTCGLKRGFSFFHHQAGQRWSTCANRCSELLVAASPHACVGDTHWYRAEFDDLVVREAQAAGVDYLDRVKLTKVDEERECLRLSGTREGGAYSVRARFVVDATGPRGFLHRALRSEEEQMPDMPQTQALFTHFRGVRPFAHRCGDTPYPVDEAAVHHLFDGGWIWILRFNNGMTSAGAAAVDAVAERFHFADGEPAWHRLLATLPSVREQFDGAQAARPFVHVPRLAFSTERIAGERWAMLPSAAGFVDPLLSTGFPLTLLGVQRLAHAMEQDWCPALLEQYAGRTKDELHAAARLVGALYARMGEMPAFCDLAMLYFASASFAESARRLGRAELASSFLLGDHPEFGPASRWILEQQGRLPDLAEQVRQCIAPVNVAGFGDPTRHNWYPVEARDLLENAGKLQASPAEIEAVLQRSGFYQ